MYIAEKIIDLCIQAKVAEQNREEALGLKSEAFMRIMMVEPHDSEPTGPTALIPNPNFNPAEKNPASPKFKKYNIESWRSFIQEYPVKIRLICDTNTFIHFLHSVRTPRDSKLEFFGVTQINGGQREPELRSPRNRRSDSDQAGRQKQAHYIQGQRRPARIPLIR